MQVVNSVLPHVDLHGSLAINSLQPMCVLLRQTINLELTPRLIMVA